MFKDFVNFIINLLTSQKDLNDRLFKIIKDSIESDKSVSLDIKKCLEDGANPLGENFIYAFSNQHLKFAEYLYNYAYDHPDSIKDKLDDDQENPLRSNYKDGKLWQALTRVCYDKEQIAFLFKNGIFIEEMVYVNNNLKSNKLVKVDDRGWSAFDRSLSLYWGNEVWNELNKSKADLLEKLSKEDNNFYYYSFFNKQLLLDNKKVLNKSKADLLKKLLKEDANFYCYSFFNNMHLDIIKLEELLLDNKEVLKFLLTCFTQNTRPLVPSHWKDILSYFIKYDKEQLKKFVAEKGVGYIEEYNQKNSGQYFDCTLLSVVQEFADLELFEFLLKHKANPNEMYREYDERYTTNLIDAVYSNNFEFVKLLVEFGADLNATKRLIKPYGSSPTDLNLVESPLYIAITNSHMDIVEYLLAKGANPNIDPINGSSLQLAINSESLDLIKLLLSNNNLKVDICFDLSREESPIKMLLENIQKGDDNKELALDMLNLFLKYVSINDLSFNYDSISNKLHTSFKIKSNKLHNYDLRLVSNSGYRNGEWIVVDGDTKPFKVNKSKPVVIKSMDGAFDLFFNNQMVLDQYPISELIIGDIAFIFDKVLEAI